MSYSVRKGSLRRYNKCLNAKNGVAQRLAKRSPGFNIKAYCAKRSKLKRTSAGKLYTRKTSHKKRSVKKVGSTKRKVKSTKKVRSPKRKVKSTKKVRSPKRKVKSTKKARSPKRKVRSTKRRSVKKVK
jgi:hypothetical protein